MYAFPGLAAACAEHMLPLASAENISQMLHLLHLHRENSPRMGEILAELRCKVKEDDKLFDSICFGKSATGEEPPQKKHRAESPEPAGD